MSTTCCRWMVGKFGDVPIITDSGRRSATKSAVAVAVGTRRARALTRVLRLVWIELVVQWMSCESDVDTVVVAVLVFHFDGD